VEGEASLSSSALSRARLLLPPAAGPAAAAVPGVLHSYAHGVEDRNDILQLKLSFEFDPKRIYTEATAQFAVGIVAPPAPAYLAPPIAPLAARSGSTCILIAVLQVTDVVRLQLGITSVGVLFPRRVLVTFFYQLGPYRNVCKLLFSLTFVRASSCAKRHSRQVNPHCFNSARMQHES
jgi:hypothetical protein